ncbi:nicotinate mononucleotide-dependent phosphoribosyltransferase CobT [Methanobrevibacter sp. DSM 116169]|uniref:nicotinate mononucleotide-dependent phosphoribosyltransferase CobT n=1 Tax=Methanobrevibacter sp. DSM 116169 TaxID=3242727 RepID=UPI0038FCC5CD
MIEGITTFGPESLLDKIKGFEPVFLCVIGTTETSKIENISGAGASAELTEYTPAADVELMVHGKVLCTDKMAETVVDGIAAPTPAVLTKASLEIGDIPFVIVDAGSKIKPNVGAMNLGTDYGRDIRTGKGVLNPLEIFENARELGRELDSRHDYLVIGESIAAGTTTALGVLKALGYSADGKVSGSMPTNPHELKLETVNEGLKNSGLDLDNIDAFQAIGAVGDPIIPAVAGLVLGGNGPIILAGATQMVAVCAVIKAIEPNFDFSRINLATTIYVAKDESADLFDLASQVDEDLTIHVVNPEFEKSSYEGLKLYLNGFAKEGAGAGGAMFTALNRGVSLEDLRGKIEKLCE